MIFRWDGDDVLVDQAALAYGHGLSVRAVQERCRGHAAACDVVTRAPLYLLAGVAPILAPVRARQRRPAGRLRPV